MFSPTTSSFFVVDSSFSRRPLNRPEPAFGLSLAPLILASDDAAASIALLWAIIAERSCLLSFAHSSACILLYGSRGPISGLPQIVINTFWLGLWLSLAFSSTFVRSTVESTRARLVPVSSFLSFASVITSANVRGIGTSLLETSLMNPPYLFGHKPYINFIMSSSSVLYMSFMSTPAILRARTALSLLSR